MHPSRGSISSESGEAPPRTAPPSSRQFLTIHISRVLRLRYNFVVLISHISIMSGPKKRLESITAQLAPSRGDFEGIPRIRRVAGEPSGPRVKDKVVIITGEH